MMLNQVDCKQHSNAATLMMMGAGEGEGVTTYIVKRL